VVVFLVLAMASGLAERDVEWLDDSVLSTPVEQKLARANNDKSYQRVVARARAAKEASDVARLSAGIRASATETLGDPAVDTAASHATLKAKVAGENVLSARIALSRAKRKLREAGKYARSSRLGAAAEGGTAPPAPADEGEGTKIEKLRVARDKELSDHEKKIAGEIHALSEEQAKLIKDGQKAISSSEDRLSLMKTKGAAEETKIIDDAMQKMVKSVDPEPTSSNKTLSESNDPAATKLTFDEKTFSKAMHELKAVHQEAAPSDTAANP